MRLDPGSAPAHFNLGVIRAGPERLAEAIDHYREALRLDPRFALAHYYLGVALLGQGRTDTTHDTYQQAPSQRP